MDKYLGYSISYERRFFNGKCFTTAFIRKVNTNGLWEKLIDAHKGVSIPDLTIQEAIKDKVWKTQA